MDCEMAIDRSSNDELTEEVQTHKKLEANDKSCKGIILEYCKNTSIHGFRYLGETKRPKYERWFWALMIMSSVTICGYSIFNLYLKWNINSIIVTPIWKIPFPAVTICPETKVRRKEFNYTDVVLRLQTPPVINPYNPSERVPYLDESEGETLDFVAQICSDNFDYDDNMLLDLLTMLKVVNYTLAGYSENPIKILRKLAPFFKTTFGECLSPIKFEDDDFIEKYKCEHKFREVITEDGICYTFNALDGSEIYRDEVIHEGFPVYSAINRSSWSLENGYESDDLSLYPLRVIKAGIRSRLQVELYLLKEDLDYMCGNYIQGFKILLHTPAESPTLAKNFFHLSVNENLKISVHPEIIQTANVLKNYSPEERQCYFSDERYLRYFKLYTQSNCELECVTNKTLEKCGCVTFYMPRNTTTPVCRLNSTICFDYQVLHTQYTCNCLPLCNSITYNAETSQTPFKQDKRVELSKRTSWDMYDFLKEREFSQLSVFYKEAQFITIKRSELYGKFEFISNIGGLFGLFMGMSLLSFGELLYFCTVRICCRRTKKKSTNEK